MKLHNRLILILLFAFSVVALPSALAQDSVPTAEPTAQATEEVQATAQATVESGGSVVIDGEGENEGDVTVNLPPTQPPPAASTDFLSGISDRTLFLGAVILFMVLHYFSNGRSSALLAKFVDPKIAEQIMQAQEKAFQTGLQIGLSIAAKTPGEEDDAAWIERAKRLGFNPVKRADGSGYDLEKIPETPPPSGTALIYES